MKKLQGKFHTFGGLVTTPVRKIFPTQRAHQPRGKEFFPALKIVKYTASRTLFQNLENVFQNLKNFILKQALICSALHFK